MERGKKSSNLNRIALLVTGFFFAVSLAGCSTPSPTPSPTPQEPTYIIADYYNSDGSFSDLALALEESDTNRKLDVVNGERFIVGNQAYEVLSDTYAVIFYTHSSLDQVTEWWIDYFETAADNGIVKKLDGH